MNQPFLQACRRQPAARRPIWLMRQAGRYLPSYRAIREHHGFLEMIGNPEIAAEITMHPIRQFDLDAAIIYSDILPPLTSMGLRLSYAKGEGPVIHNPLRTPADVQALGSGDVRETMGGTLQAIKLVKQELAGKLPLIGFSGAPFTLACYAIEGSGSSDFRLPRLFMAAEPQAWATLMERLSRVVTAYLSAQIEAGADAVQLFDSWAGILSPDDYSAFVLPYVQRIIAAVRAAHPINTPPIIYFGTGTSGMLHLIRETGADVLGADWRIPLDHAWKIIGHQYAIQGNLDPLTLHGPWELIEQRTRAILDRAGNRPGHIFNLGHGILPGTPPEHVARLVDLVHQYQR